MRCARAQTYFYTGPAFESQLFHHVHVTGIPYGKKCAPCPCTHPLHVHALCPRRQEADAGHARAAVMHALCQHTMRQMQRAGSVPHACASVPDTFVYCPMTCSTCTWAPPLTRLFHVPRRIYYQCALAPNPRHAVCDANACRASCLLPPMRCFVNKTSNSTVYTWHGRVLIAAQCMACAGDPLLALKEQLSEQNPKSPAVLARVGDPSKELSGEFSLMLNKSLAPAAGNYPIRRAPHSHLHHAAAHSPAAQLLLDGATRSLHAALCALCAVCCCEQGLFIPKAERLYCLDTLHKELTTMRFLSAPKSRMPV